MMGILDGILQILGLAVLFTFTLVVLSHFVHRMDNLALDHYREEARKAKELQDELDQNK